MSRMQRGGIAILFAVLSLMGCVGTPVPGNGLASLPNGQQLAQQINLHRPDAAMTLGEVGFIREDQVRSAAQGGPLRVTLLERSGTVAASYEHLPQPERVQALYYDRSKPRALLRAHSMQRALFKASGQWTPVLRMASGTGNVRFSFEPGEQLYTGFIMADQLNAWAQDTRFACPDGQPAFFCNGVLVRATDYSEDFHSWENSPTSEKWNRVSFSWYRADQNLRNTLRDQGFLVQPLGLPAGHPLNVRCMYAGDGSSGTLDDSCVMREQCFPRYRTAERWLAAFNNHHTSCVLPATETGIRLMTAVRQHPDYVDYGYYYNELVLAYWPPGVGRELPLYAFFHSTHSLGQGDGRPGARFIQRDFLETEGEYRPVVGFNPGDKRPAFNYDLEDQSYE